MSLAERLRTILTQIRNSSDWADLHAPMNELQTLVDEVQQMEEYVDKIDKVIDHASRQFSI